MKIALIIFMSSTIAKKPEKLKKFWTGFVPYLILVGIIAVLLLLEPHMSATVIIVVIAGAILLVGRRKNEVHYSVWNTCYTSRIYPFKSIRISMEKNDYIP